jgi:hypothetical protein
VENPAGEKYWLITVRWIMFISVLARKLIAILVGVFAAWIAGFVAAQDPAGKPDWHEQYAYT